MSKRYYPLWNDVTAFSNLLCAFRQAARGKRDRPAVVAFTLDLEEELLRLQAELRDCSYRPGTYVSFLIHEPKRRLISAAPFRDRVVHHALVNVIEPLFERQFIFDTYANRVGKGTHRALDRCTHFMRRFAFVLPVDVLRGGSWNNNQRNVRAAVRNRNNPANRNDNIGFRCVRLPFNGQWPGRNVAGLRPIWAIDRRWVPGGRAPVVPV